MLSTVVLLLPAAHGFVPARAPCSQSQDARPLLAEPAGVIDSAADSSAIPAAADSSEIPASLINAWAVAGSANNAIPMNRISKKKELPASSTSSLYAPPSSTSNDFCAPPSALATTSPGYVAEGCLGPNHQGSHDGRAFVRFGKVVLWVCVWDVCPYHIFHWPRTHAHAPTPASCKTHHTRPERNVASSARTTSTLPSVSTRTPLALKRLLRCRRD